MVQAWYQGGLSVFDFTDSAKPVEIAFFDRGPIDAKTLISAATGRPTGTTATIYGSEIARGHRRLRAEAERAPVAERDRRGDADPHRGAEHAGADEDRLAGERCRSRAPTWISSTRSKGIQPERARAVKAALDRADGMRTGKERGARAQRSISSTRWRRSSRATRPRPPDATRCG